MSTIRRVAAAAAAGAFVLAIGPTVAGPVWEEGTGNTGDAGRYPSDCASAARQSTLAAPLVVSPGRRVATRETSLQWERQLLSDLPGSGRSTAAFYRSAGADRDRT